MPVRDTQTHQITKSNHPPEIRPQNPPKSYHTYQNQIPHLPNRRHPNSQNQPRPMKSRTRTIHHHPRNQLDPQRKINNQRKKGRVRKKEKEETQIETETERQREREREKK